MFLVVDFVSLSVIAGSVLSLKGITKNGVSKKELLFLPYYVFGTYCFVTNLVLLRL